MEPFISPSFSRLFFFGQFDRSGGLSLMDGGKRGWWGWSGCLLAFTYSSFDPPYGHSALFFFPSSFAPFLLHPQGRVLFLLSLSLVRRRWNFGKPVIKKTREGNELAWDASERANENADMTAGSYIACYARMHCWLSSIFSSFLPSFLSGGGRRC
ncbi:hypothetical protein BC567DRAFT_78285 [Phyllosticta citribraziliensis]